MITLNSHYVGTVYPIGLSFGTFVADYHINLHVQENFHNCFTLGIRGAQSWSKSRNFMIFAFFAIFGQLWIFVLRATFWYSNFYIAYYTIPSLGNNNWAPWAHWSLMAEEESPPNFDTFKNGLRKRYKFDVRFSRGRKKIINFWNTYSESPNDFIHTQGEEFCTKIPSSGWKMALK